MAALVSLVLSLVLSLVAALLAIPTIVLCLEIVAAVARRTIQPVSDHTGGRVAVLVPAHNESTAIVPTIKDIKAQLRPGDRLLVVADNCNDDTATVARTSGAEVIERHDLQRIGKGYALDWGLRYLDQDAPEIVVMIDADCRVASGAIARLAAMSATSGRPAQALYLMNAPIGAGISKQVAAFAWRVKNWVRPAGLKNLNLPCQLVGSGMAFPWPVIRTTNIASGWIVEDLKLGLDLALTGYPPLFCPSAVVTSEFAASTQGTDTQRQRWEQGHLMTIVKLAPPLSLAAITHGRMSLLALTLDLAVPPLSLLAMLLMLMFAMTSIAALLGFGFTALIISAACLAGFITAVALAWDNCGRDVLPFRAILSVPFYILGKLGLYGGVLFGRKATQWVKTDRTKS